MTRALQVISAKLIRQNSATLGFVYGGQVGSGIQNHSANLDLNVKF